MLVIALPVREVYRSSLGLPAILAFLKILPAECCGITS
jgi:hypothetical protein